jgi:hypothetical protein
MCSFWITFLEASSAVKFDDGDCAAASELTSTYPVYKRNTPHLTLSNILIDGRLPPETQFHEDSFRSFCGFFRRLDCVDIFNRETPLRLFNVTPFFVSAMGSPIPAEFMTEYNLNEFSIPESTPFAVYSLLAIDGSVLKSILLLPTLESRFSPVNVTDLNLERITQRRGQFKRKYMNPIDALYQKIWERACQLKCAESHYEPVSSVVHRDIVEFTPLLNRHIDARNIAEVKKIITVSLKSNGELPPDKKKIIDEACQRILCTELATEDPDTILRMREADIAMLSLLYRWIDMGNDDFKRHICAITSISKSDFDDKMPRGRAGSMPSAFDVEGRALYYQIQKERLDAIMTKLREFCPPSKVIFLDILATARINSLIKQLGE